MIQPNEEFKFSILKNTALENPSSLPSYIAQILISEKLTYFDGHFPNLPVLPAVAIIDASLVAIGQVLEQKVSLKKVLTAKFMNPVTPGLKLQIHIQQDAQGGWATTWVDEKENKLASILMEVVSQI